MQTIKKLLFLLTPSERKSAIFLLFMTIMMAFLDMIGVASILPFMAVLTNPNLIETNNILNSSFKILNNYGINSYDEFLFTLGIFVFILLIISLLFRSLTVYFQIRFVQMREHSIGRRLLEFYLNQPYSWFLNRNSADLGKSIISEVQKIINFGVRPLIELIAKGIVTVAIITLLILTNPKLALIVSISLSGIYALIFYFAREYLGVNGNKNLKNNKERFRAFTEAFGASKEVKVLGIEQSYIDRFSKSSKIFAQTQAMSKIISQAPRYILEAVAFGGMLLIILYSIAISGSFNSSLPVISLYIFAGYRIMPALQQIYGSLTQLTFISPSLDKLMHDLNNFKTYDENQNKQDKDALHLKKNIKLKNIYYSYPNTNYPTLNNINLTIPVKSTVGFVGQTGSGKTTIVDIILSLLEAQKGVLEVDGKIITKQNARAWQRSIGYVPQHIYLSDDTVAANIAFGVERKNINQEAVEKACKIANLDEFIINDLPKNYETTIGERGVRLSGGQRQRIGIARALYHNPEVLILDEATSALDNQTEKAVMDAVNNIEKDKTIILIAHRLNTVKNCDIIFKLDKGQLTDTETFNKLFNNKNNGLTP